MGETLVKMHPLWTIWGKRPEYGGESSGVQAESLAFSAFILCLALLYRLISAVVRFMPLCVLPTKALFLPCR